MRTITLLLILFTLSIRAQPTDAGYEKWRAGKQTIESQIPTHNPQDATYAIQSDCNIPFTRCWCESHPTNPHCKAILSIPINGGLWMLMLAGILLAIYFLKKVSLGRKT